MKSLLFGLAAFALACPPALADNPPASPPQGRIEAAIADEVEAAITARLEGAIKRAQEQAAADASGSDLGAEVARVQAIEERVDGLTTRVSTLETGQGEIREELKKLRGDVPGLVSTEFDTRQPKFVKDIAHDVADVLKERGIGTTSSPPAVASTSAGTASAATSTTTPPRATAPSTSTTKPSTGEYRYYQVGSTFYMAPNNSVFNWSRPLSTPGAQVWSTDSGSSSGTCTNCRRQPNLVWNGR